MSTQVQIKFSVSTQIKELLDANARVLGLPVASYVRHLVIKDVEDDVYPVYKMSKSTELKARKALRDYKNAITVKDIDAFFDDL